MSKLENMASLIQNWGRLYPDMYKLYDWILRLFSWVALAVGILFAADLSHSRLLYAMYYTSISVIALSVIQSSIHLADMFVRFDDARPKSRRLTAILIFGVFFTIFVIVVSPIGIRHVTDVIAAARCQPAFPMPSSH